MSIVIPIYPECPECGGRHHECKKQKIRLEKDSFKLFFELSCHVCRHNWTYEAEGQSGLEIQLEGGER